MFGESFGGIFAPGLTWLFGAPGAVLFYCAAGVLIALPERAFATSRLGRIVLAGGGVFLIGMALLQAWPGSRHLAGTARDPRRHRPRDVADIAAGIPLLVAQLVRLLRHSPRLGVNLFVVVSLAAIGVLLLTGRRRLVLGAITAFVVLCLTDWVLVQDVGFLGGLGTDPNSMVPMALLFVAGYLAVVRLPAADECRPPWHRLPWHRPPWHRPPTRPARGGDGRPCPTWHARRPPSPLWPSS